MKNRAFFILILSLVSTIFSASSLFAAAPPEIGSVVALKGKAEVERGGKKVDAKVKSSLQLNDVVKTSASSRIKMLFIDDSVLTLGDNSRMAIKEFVHSKSDKGKSLFNLIDGKMRAVVGKTKFEVQTPTAVAAARGTIIYFETGIVDGKRFTKIVCIEGTVDVHGVAGFQSSIATLTVGNEITILEGVALSSPTPASPKLLEQIKRESSIGASQVKLEAPQMDDLKNIETTGNRAKQITSTGIIDTNKMEIPNIIPIVQHQQPAGLTTKTQDKATFFL